jgi:DNA-binding NtrC family response regulator
VRATILIVDDDATVREVLGRALSAAGYDVVEASSADTALALLKQRPVDVMLADLVMPKDDGLWLIGQVTTTYPDVLCVLMTGEPEAAGRPDFAELSVSVLPKPCGTAEFLDMVHTLVARAWGRGARPRADGR